MARDGIDRNAIRKMFRDIQKEFEKNGPIQVPIEVGPTLAGELFPGSGSATYGGQVVQGDVSALDLESTAIRVMDWLYDRADGSTYHSIEDFLGPEEDDGRAKAHMVGEHLDRNGWADVAFSFGDTAAMLSAAGVSRVERVRQVRNDRAARTVELQRQMIVWLYESSDDESTVLDWSDFLATSPSHLLGRPFTESEVRRQATFLHERGLITATTIDEGPDGWMHPRQTTRGEECVIHFNGEVGRYMSQGGGQSSGGNHYYGAVVQGNADGAQFAWANENVTQVSGGNRVAEGYEQAAAVVRAVLEGLPQYELSTQDQDDLKAAADEVLAEVESADPNQGKIRRGFAAIKGVLAPVATGLSVGAGEGAQEFARQAIEHLSTAL